MKPETLFRRRVDERLKQIPNSWWESIQQKTIEGTPDKLGCVAGCFVALELKATARDEPTPLQRFKLKKIRLAGGIAAVVSPANLDEITLLLMELSMRRNQNADPKTD